MDINNLIKDVIKDTDFTGNISGVTGDGGAVSAKLTHTATTALRMDRCRLSGNLNLNKRMLCGVPVPPKP